uniref:Uncharacterized protein n=1 Tax=Moumouvirus sp. 'Monve' TaxID=1128131 RepID=H2EDW7_9VIRU|nr:hypothetical protein mv_R385 [Moumouvirus Monve]
MNKNNEKNKFNTNPIILKANASGKTLSIPIKKIHIKILFILKQVKVGMEFHI